MATQIKKPQIGLLTSVLLFGSGSQYGHIGGSSSDETNQVICRSNSASNKFVAQEVYFSHPFIDSTGLTITISNEFVFAPGSNVNRASGASKGTALHTNSQGNVIGFTRYYSDNTNFVANGAHLCCFDWTATRT